MIVFQAIPREQMDANHARQRPAEAAAPRPQARNGQAVLDLGNTLYFTFRGRAYGIPPLGWRAGQELLLLWVEASHFPSPLTPESGPRYFAILRQFPRLLWRNCFPASRLLRVLRRVGLLRNPFLKATERELVESAGFFLPRRLSSSIHARPAPAP